MASLVLERRLADVRLALADLGTGVVVRSVLVLRTMKCNGQGQADDSIWCMLAIGGQTGELRTG